MTTLAVERRAPAPVKPPPQRPPNQVALQITGRNYVSHSQLSLMRACPRAFAYSYVENAPRDHLPCSLILGGSVHASLEAFYRARLEGLTLSASEMLHIYHTAWQEDLRQAGASVPVKFNKGEDETTVHALAQRMFAAFLASPLANPKGTVLGVEEQLRVVLHPDLPDLLAKVDLVTMSDTAVYVTDFKTARSRWTDDKAREAGDQLVLYGVMAANMARHVGLPIRLSFAVLTKAKSPKVQILTVPIDKARVASMTETALATWSAIRNGDFYTNPSPMTCNTCQFHSRCPVFAGK